MMRTITLQTALGLLLALLPIVSPAVAGDAPEVVRYDGHKLVRVHLENDKQVDLMISISTDCWNEAHGVGVCDFHVTPQEFDVLRLSGIAFEVLIEDLQTRVGAERSRLADQAQADGVGWYEDFKNLAAIETRLVELAADHPGVASLIDIGDSLQGRDIWAVRISGAGSDKPAVLYNATQHAREWIAPMVDMYVAESLITGYGSDPVITDLVDDLEIYVIPVVNPDGYNYSWVNERYWRKNRRNNGDGTFGVDLNRNWDFGWGGGGSSGDTNSETYRGPSPFSEPETQVMAAFYAAHPNLVASIDFHSYGELALYPWAFQSGGPDDGGAHDIIGGEMADAIMQVHGRNYVLGPIFDTLYQASGGSVDWTWGDQGVISYTIELRGTDFVIDADQIIPTAEENLAAALAMAERARSGVLYLYPDGGVPPIVEAGLPTTLRVDITPLSSGPLDADSSRLMWRIGNGGAFTETTVAHVGGNEYEATLPAIPCGQEIEFYFEIESMKAVTYSSPQDAPVDRYVSGAFDITMTFSDDFESDTGWTVENVSLTDGAWDRGVPAGGDFAPGDRGDPPADADGSGQCYMTDNTAGNSDVDGGPTRMISPALDLTGAADPHLRYSRWFTNDDGDEDRLDVHLSNNGGDTWTLVESAGHSTGWTTRTIRIADYVEPSADVRVRFSATDNPNDSVTEAGIDGIQIFALSCDGVPGDVDGDGDVDFSDLVALLSTWGPCPGCPADFDGNGAVDFTDLLTLLANFG